MTPILLLVVATTLTTQPPRRGGACEGDTTLQIDDCLAGALGQAEAMLHRYRAAAQARVAQEGGSADTPAAFAKAEAAWTAYKDAECTAVFDNWSEATIRAGKETGCEIELTRLHTHTLWREWLTFEDSTPPVLPEPPIPAAP